MIFLISLNQNRPLNISSLVCMGDWGFKMIYLDMIKSYWNLFCQTIGCFFARVRF